MFRTKYIFILAGIFMLIGCFPDTEDLTEAIIKPVKKTVIASANVVINVTDETGQTMTGLTARFNKQSKIINQASFFQFETSDILKENELLTITDKDGQIYEFSLFNIENQVNYHNLSLFRNSNKKNFSSSEGSLINYPSGKIFIDLTNTEFKLGNETFAGSINCLYHEIDLKNPYHVQSIPGGNLIDINGKFSFIELLHVFRFDLMTQNEKYLSLSNSKNISFDFMSEGTSHIIQYDRIKKNWVYHGIFSNKQGVPIQSSGIYAIVYLSEPAIISGTFKANNLPLIKQSIDFEYEDKKHQAFTTNTGKWEILVPKNKIVSVYPDLDCIGQNDKIIINTKDDFRDSGITNFSIPSLREINLKGSFKDCEAKSLSEGFIKIQNGNEIKYLFIPESDFEWMLPLCESGSVSFGAAGTNGERMSDISFQSDLAEMGNIFLCPGLENQFISINTKDGNIIYSGDISVNDQNGEFRIHFKSTSQEFLFNIRHNEQVGNVIPSEGNLIWKDLGFKNKGIEVNCPTSNTCGFEEIVLLSYQKDNWIKGNFKGNFWGKTFIPLTAGYQKLEGDFFIKF